SRHLGVDEGLRQRMTAALGDAFWRTAPDDEVRARLAHDPPLAEAALSPRDRETLDFGYRERVWDLHLPHVRELPRALPPLFAEAARRAQDAGFDGVELHYAHAYTMASFLSRLNVRTDGYGGSRGDPARAPPPGARGRGAAAGGHY